MNKTESPKGFVNFNPQKLCDALAEILNARDAEKGIVHTITALGVAGAEEAEKK